MAESKVHSCLSMTLGEKRTFFLHHSLHAGLLQVTTDGLGGDGLVLDILKGSGNLDSIFSLSSSNKSNSIAYISRGNEGRATTRGLG